ncbi:hypothetical protein IB286_15190 [Spongiibacter sp. KMU-158]|uniref:Tetratricopeptide repeat protein n=1 Tax=Spongiibacter pelagi TaxID=2760804 RepID=A0A927C2Y5_9GAMM|nr:hypothetical protein [Spongiibacter pelagi]MBD2860338.1 hypothetical protein [Spongiibacter pelagi]
MKNLLLFVFVLCTACAAAISKNLYGDLLPIEEIYQAGDYKLAKLRIDHVEEGIGSKYVDPIDKKMIYGFKGSILSGLKDYEQSIIYYRKAADIKTDNAALEIRDIASLIKLCASIGKEECAREAYQELPDAVALHRKDGDAKLVLDFSYLDKSDSAIPVPVVFDIDAGGIPLNIIAEKSSASKRAVFEALKLAAMLRYIPKIVNGEPAEASGVKVVIWVKPKWVNS